MMSVMTDGASRFNAEDILGKKTVDESVDAHFDDLMANWKPRSARSGAVVRAANNANPDFKLSAINVLTGGALLPPPPSTTTTGSVSNGGASGTKLMSAVRKMGPPPPITFGSAGAGEDAASQIAESRARMEAMLAKAEAEGSTKIQAAFRGKQDRKAAEEKKAAIKAV